jgi:ADP-ribose pyrophosphatase
VTGLADTPAAYETVDSSLALASGRIIDVRTDVVRLPGGESVTRDVVVHPGAVGVIALDADDRVLLVRQYRHPVGRLLWEAPAGLLDEPGESPLDAARRELFEETHHEAGRWDVLVDVFTSPGMTDESVRIYLAREVKPATGERFEAEGEERDLTVEWLPLDDAVEAVLGGRLHNPMAVTGVLAARAARERGYRGLRPADADWPEMSHWPGSRAAHGDEPA